MSEQNIVNVMVIPDVPKVLPGEQLYVYVPKASFTSPGIIAYNNEQFEIDGNFLFIRKDYVSPGVKQKIDELKQYTDEQLQLKQDKEDNNISLAQRPEQKSVVGAINDLGTLTQEAKNAADQAQATADNATTLANNGISKAEQAQQTADHATELANTGISKAEQAQTTANEAKSSAQTAENNANSAIDTADSALDRANKAYEKAANNVYAVGFMTLEEAITAVNGYDNTMLKTNDNILVVAQGSPDLYVTSVEATSVPYNFTTVDDFNDDLVKNTVLQIGYYKVAFYETDGQPVTVAWQNVVVNNWVASTEFADFPYEAKIELTDFVDYKTVPQVVFDIADTMSGNYAPICKSGDKCVYIYGKVNTAITLKTVITFAPNVNGASVTGGGYNNRGKWVASTTYEIDDLVYTDKGQYVCIEGITSTTSPDNDTTHWQASFVATAGTTENGLKISGQNGNGTEVQKTFDGSQAVEMAFDENDFTLTEKNGVLEVKTNATVPEALPQEASALKSGNLPITGWTNVTAPLWQGVATFDKNGGNKTLLCNIGVKWNNRDEMPLTGWAIEYSYIGDDNRYTITTLRKDDSVSKNGIFYGFGSGSSYPYLEIDVNGNVYGWTLYTYISGRTIYKIEQQSLSKQGYIISDTTITVNSDILMELTDDGGVKAYSMEAGKITVIRDTVPTQPIPYTYKVKQTNASGQFTVLNHFVPSIPESPTSLPVTYKKVNGELPTSGWENEVKSADLWNGSVIVTGYGGSPAYEVPPSAEQDLKNIVFQKTGKLYLYTDDGKEFVCTYSESYSTSSSYVYVGVNDGIKMGISTAVHSSPLTIGANNYDSANHTVVAMSTYKLVSGNKTYTIADTFITANSSVKMYLTDEGGVKAQNKAVGSITVIRDSVPTTAIPYEYEVEQTSAEGLFEVINAYVPAVPTKTSDLTNDSGFIKPSEANTFTAEQTFSNENGIKTNRVHNLNGNAWYDFDGTNDRLGSLATPTIVRTSEARPKAEVPSGSATAIKELALLEDVSSAGEWVTVTGETAVLTQAGTYQVIASDMQSIVYWDGSKVGQGASSTRAYVVGETAFLHITIVYPSIDASGTLSILVITVSDSTGKWVESTSKQSGFKYRKIN